MLIEFSVHVIKHKNNRAVVVSSPAVCTHNEAQIEAPLNLLWKLKDLKDIPR